VTAGDLRLPAAPKRPAAPQRKRGEQIAEWMERRHRGRRHTVIADLRLQIDKDEK